MYTLYKHTKKKRGAQKEKKKKGKKKVVEKLYYYIGRQGREITSINPINEIV
jgi:hypothetical protein